MNKSILIIALCLFKISLSDVPIYYRPMSKRSIDFGDDVCYYEDISNDFKLKYVKGCPSGKSCKLVGTTSDEYKIHTCQNVYSVSKRNSGETCDSGLYECIDSLTCTNKKCTSEPIVTPGPSPDCTTISKQINDGDSICITAQTELQEAANLCEVRDTGTSTTTTYTHYPEMTCLKIEIANKQNVENKYIISKVYAEIYSIQDGEYVEENHNEYCQSGFSLYFYEKGQLNPVGDELFKRCVTVLAIEPISSSSPDYLIKYKINDGEEHIYDTSKLTVEDKRTIQNRECSDNQIMLKLEIFKHIAEEYKKNNSNGLKKWQYLYGNPNDYLLYKDQTDVLDYLIQQDSSFSDYIPEKYATNKDSQQITQESEATDTTDTTNTTTQDETGFSRLLNIKYLSMLLFLFLL